MTAEPLPSEYMELALAEARIAAAEDEVPVGAVIVHRERGVIARDRNRREQLRDPTAHAEVLAIRSAAAILGAWRLSDCALYVTLEPCPMCAGAIVQARLPVLIFGATDLKAGACETLYRIADDPRLNHRCRVEGGLLAGACAALLSEFFQSKRRLGKK